MLDQRRHSEAREVVDWIERNGANLFLSVMTIAEMEAGILKLRRQRKTSRADGLSQLMSAIVSEFADRVLPMDLETAKHVARLGELTHKQPISLPDLVIAATATQHGLTVLTRNVREFGRLGILVIDPIASLPPDT